MSSPASVLGEAMAAHKDGRFAEAEAGYTSVLRARPNDAKALYYLGLLHFHRGDHSAALARVNQCLTQAPRNAHAWNTLGGMLVAQGRGTEAKQAYQRVTEVAPAMAEGWYNLGICMRNESQFEGAVATLQEALARDPDYFRAHEALAMLLYELGRTEDAARVYAQWSERDPSNPKARHMAAATSRLNVPGRASDEYIQALFDSSAAGFNGNLEQLAYRAPELVAMALNRHMPNAFPLDVLDGGCGTGLCGALIHARCHSLVGVDLSSKMIERAREGGRYDELIVGELCALMRTRPDAFDAVLCVDTLVYFGALEEPLDAALGSVRTGGVLIFTVETLSGDSHADHRLEAHGRYAHSEAYLRRALSSTGFALESLTRETLRQERLQNVAGYLVAARKTG